MKVYISGIGGGGAYYLAEYFLRLGEEVYGSDIKNSERLGDLQNKGGKIRVGEPDLKWVRSLGDIKLYVYSSALRKDHSERVYFAQGDIRVREVGELTDELLQQYFQDQLDAAQRKAVIDSDLAPLIKIDWSAREYFAVTGTDGKTTTVSMIYHLLRKLGKRVAMINTLGITVDGMTTETGLHVTSPTAQELFKFLNSPEFEDVEAVVLEVTSHALSMGRVAGASFDAAVITNITSDHLDYHQSWKNYFQAKARLVTDHLKPTGIAIINKKDPQSYQKLLKICDDQNIKHFAVSGDEMRGLIRLPDGMKSNYNLFNATAAWNAVKAVYPEFSNSAFTTEVEAFRDFPGVKGRMEIMHDNSYKVIVDFAHTENALKEVLQNLREKMQPSARLRVVFGCAGMRDKTKRAKMGEVAEELTDAIYLCPEDPRLESLPGINRQILSGMGIKIGDKDKGVHQDKLALISPRGKPIKVFQLFSPRGRRDAIVEAIQDAASGDVIVICGKGHETSLCFGTTEFDWSDQGVVKSVISDKT